MKIEPKETVTSYQIELTPKETKQLLHCLSYCFHRANKHIETGKIKAKVDPGWINQFREELASKIGWS